MGGYSYFADSSISETGFEQGNFQNMPDYDSNNTYLTDIITDEAVKFITTNGSDPNNGRPFFLFFAHYTVHDSKDEDGSGNEALEATADDFNDVGGPPTGYKHQNQVYAAMVHSMDRSVGEVLDSLSSLGGDVRDNTIIIFCSDNGGHEHTTRGYVGPALSGNFQTEERTTDNAPLLGGKGNIYEGGIRVPMIVVGPDINPNTTCDEPVSSIDFFPTIMGKLGINYYPVGIDGEDLSPLLDSDPETSFVRNDLLYWHSNVPNTYDDRLQQEASAAVRDGRYKLIKLFPPVDNSNMAANVDEYNKIMLFDLANDISEQHDLSEIMPEKAKDLEIKLDDWLATIDAPLRSNDNGYTGDTVVYNKTRTKWYKTIEDYLNGVISGDTVVLMPTTYNENITITQDITLTSLMPDNRWFVENTVIDGGGNGSVITISSNCTIQGLTVTNGNSSAGGGIFGGGNGGEISNCKIYNNTATYGGGIAASHGTIRNCLVYNNQATRGGGLNNCDGSIVNCTIVGNTAISEGGGLGYCDTSIGQDPSITNCIIWGNVANDGNQVKKNPNENTSRFSYCDIQDSGGSGNWDTSLGTDGDHNIDEDPQFINAPVFVDITSQTSGQDEEDKLYVNSTNGYSQGAIVEYNNDGIQREITHVDSANDYVKIDPPLTTLAETGEIISYWGSTPTSVKENYHLNYGSDCIDEGDPSGDYNSQADIDGDERVIDILGKGDGNVDVDMGADEYSGLVAEWTMDSVQNSTLSDSSGNGYNGVLEDHYLWKPGVSNSCLNFTGDDSVKIDGAGTGYAFNGISGSNPRTCSAWIKTTSEDKQVILSWGNSNYVSDPGTKWMLRMGQADINGDAYLEVGVWGGVIYGTTTSINDGQWHHVAAVLIDDDSPRLDEILLFVDGGQEITSCTATPPEINTDTDINAMIGARENVDLDSLYFSGSIDDVRIYAVALSETDVIDLSQFNSITSNPVAHWEFDEDATDSSGNDHHGTISDNGDIQPGDRIITGDINNALELDGDDYIEISHFKGISGNSPRTCTAWIKLNSDFSDKGFISYWGGSVVGQQWGFRVGSYWSDPDYNKLEVGVFDGVIRGSTVLNADTSYHVAAVYTDIDENSDGNIDLGDVLLYVNGQLETNCTLYNYDQQIGLPTINTASLQPVHLGAKIDEYGEDIGYFSGMLDDVRIYNRALKATEINDLYLMEE